MFPSPAANRAETKPGAATASTPSEAKPSEADDCTILYVAKQGVALDEPRAEMTLVFSDQNIGDEDFGGDQVTEPLQLFDGWTLRYDGNRGRLGHRKPDAASGDRSSNDREKHKSWHEHTHRHPSSGATWRRIRPALADSTGWTRL